MTVDQKEFFRKATIRICSHLEIEQVLQSCFTYLRSFIPIRRMYLHLENPEKSSMHFIARASLANAEQLDLTMQIPEEHRPQFKEYEEYVRLGADQIFAFNEPDELARHIFDFLKEPHSPAMGLGFVVGSEMPIAGVTVFGETGCRFDEAQTDLLRILKEPFVLTLMNALKHRVLFNEHAALKDHNRFLQAELRRIAGDRIIGAEFGLREVMSQVAKVAPTESPVLLSGETGVGKDLVANSIHLSSLRREEPFIAVNCGAIPESLLDSELFGHEKGAFTGALSRKRGRFERADKGTILLDEIGEMPLRAQVRLLRVLQNHQIERVGGTKTISLDIRIITATNKDLANMVASGRFREDLYFRLNVFPIRVPPLRERTSDIPALVQYFIERKAKELKIGETPSLAEGALGMLMAYGWPGNVRELENVVERAMILHRGEPLDFEDVGISAHGTVSSGFAAAGKQPIELEAVIAGHIKRVLEMTGGKIHGPDGAGELLAVNPNTLRTKMKKLGIPFKKS